MKLYEITNEFESIFNDVDENGEITQAMVDAMDGLKDEFDNKAILIASYIKNIEAEENAIKLAMDDMKKRRESLISKADSLTEYLKYSMVKMSVTDINTSPLFRIRLKKCPVSVDIINELSIPAEYFREKIVTSVDKIKLKEVLSEGAEVPGACLQRKTKLEIK